MEALGVARLTLITGLQYAKLLKEKVISRVFQRIALCLRSPSTVGRKKTANIWYNLNQIAT